MTVNLADRLRKVVRAAGNGDELSRISGVPRRTLENYLSGKSEPKSGNLASIAAATNTSLDWLILGKAQ